MIRVLAVVELVGAAGVAPAQEQEAPGRASVSFDFDDGVSDEDRAYVRDGIRLTQDFAIAELGRDMARPATVDVCASEPDMRYANYSSGSCIILQASHPSGVERFPSIRRVQNQVHEYFRIFRDELRGRDFDHGAGGSQGLVEAASSTSAFAPSHGRAASTYGVVRSYHRLNVAYGQPLPTLEELEDRGLFIRIQGLSYSLAALAVELLHGGTGTQVRLIPERTYGTSGALRSISYAERPDVAVEVTPVDGPPRVYLFDPKYKLDGEPVHGDGSDGRPHKGDIDKMHAYRDAVRDAAGERVVRSAAILYPGPAVRYAAGIEALPAYPGAERALMDQLRSILGEALMVSAQPI